MSTNVSKLITREAQWHANMTDVNHLGKALMIAPHKLMSKIDTLFSAQNYYSNNPLSSILKNITGGEIKISGTEWEWEMKGADTRPLVVLEDVENNPTPGKFKRRFKIKLDENWYKTSDVISPGTSAKKYPCVIVDGPTRHGDGFVYTLQLMTTDEQDFLPKKYISAGQSWVKGYSISGEAAEKGGSTQFATPISFRNKLTKFRKQHMITDYASTEVLRVALPDSNGNLQKSWLRYADVEFFKQWYQELEYSR